MSQIIGEFDNVFRDSYVSTQVSVGTSAVELKCGSCTLFERELIFIQNLGPEEIFYGPTGVSASTGASLGVGERMGMMLGQVLQVYALTESGTSTVAVQELA